MNQKRLALQWAVAGLMTPKNNNVQSDQVCNINTNDESCKLSSFPFLLGKYCIGATQQWTMI